MKLTKCNNNHYYDTDKFLSCPHCANQQTGIPTEELLGQNQESIITQIPQAQDLSSYCQMSSRKTVGWLVCVKGSMVGESFVLKEGDNFIGRAGNMDIALIYEPSVSKENHALITYDSIKKSFLLQTASKDNLILCNNKTLKNTKSLRSRDIITLGSCILVFIPFCNASFSWENFVY